MMASALCRQRATESVGWMLRTTPGDRRNTSLISSILDTVCRTSQMGSPSVLDGGAPERNGRRHQRPTRPDDLLKRPNGLPGLLGSPETYRTRCAPTAVARNYAQFQQRALQIRWREYTRRLLVGTHEALQPALDPGRQQCRGSCGEALSDPRGHPSSRPFGTKK